MQKNKVLVVEDDVDIRSLVVMALEEDGYLTFEAANGEEALLFLTSDPEAKNIGCVLLDLMMPKMGGAELISIIKGKHSDSSISKIPILVTSADGTYDPKSSSSSGVGFLAKPIDLDTLLNTVKETYNVP